MKIVLVRHGATEWSELGRHTGVTDLPLTELGIEQAHRAGEALHRLLGDELARAWIFSSPLRRALETAQIVFGADASITICDELHEVEYGRYEGLTTAQIRDAVPGWDMWRDGYPDGEMPEDAGVRVDRFLERIQGVGDVAVVFSHGHLLRVLAARAIGLPASEGKIFGLDTATISLMEDARDERVIALWNLDPRLVG